MCFLLCDFWHKVDCRLVIGDADALEAWQAVLGWSQHPGSDIVGGIGENSFGNSLKSFEDWFDVGRGRVDGIFSVFIGVVPSSQGEKRGKFYPCDSRAVGAGFNSSEVFEERPDLGIVVCMV